MKKAYTISELNDVFRQTFIGGKVLMTVGIRSLPDAVRAAIVSEVTLFDKFTEDNDPHGEHDFGAFDQTGAGKVFWKIDYYDKSMERGSEDPCDPEQTCRVLTIMLASEY